MSPKVSVDYIPHTYLEKSVARVRETSLFSFMVDLLGESTACEILERYQVGGSKRNPEKTAFWQIDEKGNVRQVKVMTYNAATGRRIKTGKYPVFFAGKKVHPKDEPNLQQCFFGEHLLPLQPDATVGLVESEKTALIMAAMQPDLIWLATGGANGARWTDETIYRVLSDRKVIVFPDLDKTYEWTNKAKILNTVCDVSTSDFLAVNTPAEDHKAGYDLADYFIKMIREDNSLPPGWKIERFKGGHEVVITEQGIPASW